VCRRAKSANDPARHNSPQFPIYESLFRHFNYHVTPGKKIFGTDGVRGVANVEPVTAETALKLGRAAAHVFTQLNPRTIPEGARPKIVLGKDTRLSGYMLENALVAGITSLGVDVLIIGPLPTPGVAYITRALRADAGIVLSASHNSYEDNGIKFFRHDGYKLDDQVEQKIEQLVFAGEVDSIRPTAGKIGRAARIDDALGRYVEFAKASFSRGMSLEEMRVAVDVANGAAYKSTPCVLRELGAEVIIAHNEPNGMNINAQCGSTHPREIQRLVKESGADVGITHDGDADRVLLCDENGEIVDGDEILAIASVDLLHAGRLEQNTLVATVMSNFGLDETLAAHGGKVVRTKVGDRYVIEEMVARKLNLGGEQSGHIIFRDFTTTGDGIISALQILRIMHKTGQPLSKLKTCLKKFPQAQRNLVVKAKPPIEELREVVKLRDEIERELAGQGRVLLRYSGTEPKIRLLIEGRELDKIDKQANRIANAIQNAIGAN
jgi:phosphoglucosamine mutase